MPAGSETLADARTVVHMHQFLEELKERTRSELRDGQAFERGYVSAAAEMIIRQIQVAYWQTRTALFEILAPLRNRQQSDAEILPEQFVVALAAVLELVDAARFLREMFHCSPVIRCKLDEPDPIFRIPDRMYTKVQRSLTAPVHVWEIYQAMRHFDRYRQRFEAACASSELRDVLDVIARLEHRVRISLWTVLRVRVRVRGSGLRSLGVGWVAAGMYRIQRAVSSAMADWYVRPGHRPGMPPEIVTELLSILEPGDIIVCRKEHAVTNYFLPGFWPHAALFLGDAASLQRLGIRDHDQVRPRWDQIDVHPPPDSEPTTTQMVRRGRVLEAMKDGVRIRDVGSPLASDSVVVLRPLIEREHIAEALARGLAHEGKPYDFDFDFSRSDRMVCTEVVYRAYDGIGPLNIELPLHVGRRALAAGDLIRLALRGAGFRPVAVYSPQHEPKICVDAAAAQILGREEGPPD